MRADRMSYYFDLSQAGTLNFALESESKTQRDCTVPHGAVQKIRVWSQPKRSLTGALFLLTAVRLALASAVLDAQGKTISIKVPILADSGSVGIGDLFSNLPSASGAVNEDILSAFGGNVNMFGLSNLVQFANLLHTAGTVTTPQLVTILTALIPAWIAKVVVPYGSGVVRIAS